MSAVLERPHIFRACVDPDWNPKADASPRPYSALTRLGLSAASDEGEAHEGEAQPTRHFKDFTPFGYQLSLPTTPQIRPPLPAMATHHNNYQFTGYDGRAWIDFVIYTLD